MKKYFILAFILLNLLEFQPVQGALNERKEKINKQPIREFIDERFSNTFSGIDPESNTDLRFIQEIEAGLAANSDSANVITDALVRAKLFILSQKYKEIKD